MNIEERALPERLTWPAIPIGHGEVCDLNDPAQAADWSLRIGKLIGELKRMKTYTDEALRDTLADQAATTLQLGDLEVSETTGTASYDVTWLMEELGRLGMAESAVQSLFEVEWKVRDAKELQKIENRHENYGKAIAQARSRKRGYVKVRAKRQSAPAPRVPEAVHRQVIDEARANREAESEAEDLGI